jgi:5'-3' exonuclease
MQLHLLDATFELFRSYFGAPKRTAPDGREVGAIAGILNSTLALLDEPGVTHLAAATDQVIESFRNDLFPGYKTGEGIEPDLLAQFPLAEEALEALGVVVWRMVEFEADDAIATAAWKYADDFDQVVILSPDKDLSQCVMDSQVVTYDRMRRILRDEQGVWDKFGVGPASIPDYLALVGDSSDGIPGLRGWGAKSTSAVLAHYRTLEAIPKDVTQWEVSPRGAGRLSAALNAYWDEALLFRELATLRRDVPLGETAEDLEWRGARAEAYRELCERLGFNQLLDRPLRWQ